MPVRLSEAGIGEDRFEQMAEKACMFGSIGGFKKLSEQDIVEIFRIAR